MRKGIMLDGCAIIDHYTIDETLYEIAVDLYQQEYYDLPVDAKIHVLQILLDSLSDM